MDKPKINLRAWEPLEKRKQKKSKIETEEEIHLFNMSRNRLQEELPEPLVRDREPMVEKKPDDKVFERTENITQNLYGPIYVADDSQYDYWDRNNRSSYSNASKRPRKKSKKKIQFLFHPHLFKSISAGAGAIITGMLIGYILLYYFVPALFQQDLTTNESNVENVQSNTGDHESQDLPVQVIPMKTIYLLQAGVFSDLTGAQSMVAEHKNNGQAAVIAGEGPYHIFVGMSSTKEDAEKLKELFGGTEIYVKAYEIPQYQGKMSDQTYKILSECLAAGNDMVSLLSRESVQRLENPQYSIGYEQIQNLHQQFVLSVQALKKALEQDDLIEEQKVVETMAQQLDYAIMALNAYKKNANDLYLWNIQELLINYEMSYEGLVML